MSVFRELVSLGSESITFVTILPFLEEIGGHGWHADTQEKILYSLDSLAVDIVFEVPNETGDHT